MQINRLFEIVYLLMGKRAMTAKDLAEHFEVSVRTIYRDIDTLNQAGIPVYTIRGKGGGISLMEGFVLNRAALTEEERQQIVLSLQSLPATGHIDTSKTLSRLGAFLAGSETDWIEVDSSRWGQTPHDSNRFALIKSSILEQTAIRFEYISSNGTSSMRTVCPLKLIFKSQAWYLQGFCLSRNDYRTFKVNRILNLRRTEESFDRSAYNPPPLERNSSTTEEPTLIELLVAPSSVHRLYDEFDESCIERLEDGSAHIMVRIPVNDWLLRYLASFGIEVEVLQPRSLVDSLRPMRHDH